jgi:hypothetical protein
LNFNEDLVNEEGIAIASARSSQSACVRGTEFVALQPNRLTADLDAAPRQQIFYTAYWMTSGGNR